MLRISAGQTGQARFARVPNLAAIEGVCDFDDRQ
jgi:hypothetical protein